MTPETSIQLLAKPPVRRRHLSRQINRAFAPALVEAIDRMDPEHPNYAYWQEQRTLLAILSEVAS